MILKYNAMGHNQNLIPGGHKLTLEEQSAGGKASGKARRERRQMREMLAEALQVVVTNSQGESKTLEEIGALKVAEQYAKGNLKAAEFIAKLMGEFEQKVKLEGNMRNVEIVVNNPETAEKLSKILGE